MKKIKLLIAGISVFAITSFGLVAVLPTANSYALDPLSDVCSGSGASDNVVCQNQDDDPNQIIHNVVNILLYIIGILSVVMIIYGGILYAISSGDTGKVTMAKNTIMYAVIGLIVALVAFAIVSWVFEQFVK